MTASALACTTQAHSAGPEAATAASLPVVAGLALCVLVLSLAAAIVAWSAWRQQRLATHLREARAQWQALADQLDVWQWQTDAEHRLTLLRPPHGAPAAQWRASPQPAPLWEHFRCADEAALRLQLQSAAALHDIAVERRANTGAPRPGLLRGRARTDATGGFAGYVGTLRELTEAPIATAPAPASAPTAEPAVEAGLPALAVAEPIAPDAADPDHESFGYTVSHDLRAPIRVVEGFTKIIKEDYGRLLDRVGNDHLDRVLGAATRMNSMIDALLALSKLSSQPLARQPVNLSQLGTYVADDLRRQAPDREVRIEIEPGLQTLGDPTLLRVVLENLLGNAWKYTSKCAQAHISFGRSREQPGAFTVRDNGAGFDMRFADRLFGVFQRLHSANDFPGTGVGLASVRRIIRRHGGEIWGEAEVNRGASFHFSLPSSGETRP